MPYKNAVIYYWSGTGNSYRVSTWMGKIIEEKGFNIRILSIDKEKSIEENFQSPAAQAGKAGRVTTKDMTKQESAQDGAEPTEGPQDTPEQQWLARILDERDGAEAQASKNLMKSVMGKQLGGGHGKKCW